jgi:hypothetical protein
MIVVPVQLCQSVPFHVSPNYIQERRNALLLLAATQAKPTSLVVEYKRQDVDRQAQYVY